LSLLSRPPSRLFPCADFPTFLSRPTPDCVSSCPPIAPPGSDLSEVFLSLFSFYLPWILFPAPVRPHQPLAYTSRTRLPDSLLDGRQRGRSGPRSQRYCDGRLLFSSLPPPCFSSFFRTNSSAPVSLFLSSLRSVPSFGRRFAKPLPAASFLHPPHLPGPYAHGDSLPRLIRKTASSSLFHCSTLPEPSPFLNKMLSSLSCIAFPPACPTASDLF